jgi:hypothetical protein
MPMAMLRCLGLLKVAMMMASEDRVKTAMPIKNSRRRPYTSASLPPASSSPASASR